MPFVRRLGPYPVEPDPPATDLWDFVADIFPATVVEDPVGSGLYRMDFPFEEE